MIKHGRSERVDEQPTYSDTHDAGMQHAIDIISGMIASMEPLALKYPGSYERRLSLMRVAIGCIAEQMETDEEAEAHP